MKYSLEALINGRVNDIVAFDRDSDGTITTRSEAAQQLVEELRDQNWDNLACVLGIGWMVIEDEVYRILDDIVANG